MVFHAERGRRKIQNPQSFAKDIDIFDAVDFLCLRIQLRIRRVDAVDIFGEKDDVSSDLGRSEHRRGIR